MGMVSTEQAVKIIEAAQPEAQPEPNYWVALSLVVIPAVLIWWLNKKANK